MNTLIHIYMNLIMATESYKEDPYEVQTIMATRIRHQSMRRRLKLGHSYQTYNVDVCHMDANLSTTTTIQMWIHPRTHTNTPP